MIYIITFLITLFLLPFFLLILFFLIVVHGGNPFFFSKRIGKNNKIFLMPKFKTLIDIAPIKSTESFINIKLFYIIGGFFIKKCGLDEIPQLFLVLLGKMNLIGPRPILPSQKLIKKFRTKHNICKLKPGIIGYAQIFSISNSIHEKNRLDKFYLENKSFILDIKIILFSIILIIKRIF